MKKLLITGSDGSLGSALVAEATARGFSEVVMMPKAIYKKPDIEMFLAPIWGITHAILNDGTNHLSWIGKTQEEDDEIVARNLLAPYWALNVLARSTVACRVVLVTSQTYRVPQRTTALYCASKAGATMMMRVAARELAPKGWVINAVAPGKIADTHMSELTDAQVLELRGWKPEHADKYAKALIPAGRFTTKEEIADVIYRTLELPAYVNGTVVEAFGGV